MNYFAIVFSSVLVACSTACVIAYCLGAFLAPRIVVFEKLGALAYRKKMKLLDGPWPMTVFRSATVENRLGIAVVIVSALITLKSLLVAVIGIVGVFLLPASVATMPAILAHHECAQRELFRRWAILTMVLQGASHVVAAALGFTPIWIILRTQFTLSDVLRTNWVIVGYAAVGSLVLAIAAGCVEAYGQVRLNLLGLRKVTAATIT